MKKSEFERKIKELKLEKIHRNGKIQVYSQNHNELYKDNKRDNLYGCYYDDKDKEYVIFFTDAERGIVEHIGVYRTEDDAYDNLFQTIKEWEAEYNQNNK